MLDRLWQLCHLSPPSSPPLWPCVPLPPIDHALGRTRQGGDLPGRNSTRARSLAAGRGLRRARPWTHYQGWLKRTMSTARSDLLIYVGVALSTTLGLFVLHAWYATYLDQRYHEQLAQHGPSEALLAAREEEQASLNAGKIPLAQAMATIARPGGRPA